MTQKRKAGGNSRDRRRRRRKARRFASWVLCAMAPGGGFFVPVKFGEQIAQAVRGTL